MKILYKLSISVLMVVSVLVFIGCNDDVMSIKIIIVEVKLS